MSDLQKETILRRMKKLGPQFPWRALKMVVDTLEEGNTGKYAHDPLRWRGIDVSEHLEHMQEHLVKQMEGDAEEPHAAHMVTRCMFAAERMLETASSTAQIAS